jgi:hypothetical protein
MTKRYQSGNQEDSNQRSTDNTIVSPSLIYGFWITPLVSFGHCIVSPSLISTFLITPLVSFGGNQKVLIKEELTIQ